MIVANECSQQKGSFKDDVYTTERIMVVARDGVKVPIILVYKNAFKKDNIQAKEYPSMLVTVGLNDQRGYQFGASKIDS
ncbi:MAG: protease II [Paraglaciecola sp.]